jgi:glycosyltransferase involved in cell wall biosynthesis
MTAAIWPQASRISKDFFHIPSVLMVTGRADYGGGPEHVFQLAKVVSRTNPVFIACPKDEPYWERYQSVVGPERMLELPHRCISPGAFRKLMRFIRENGIDIIHAHGRSGGVYARPAAVLTGKPCFYTPHGSTPVCNVRTAIYATAEYLLSLVTRGVIAVSGTEAQELKPLCAFPSRLEVIENGVEIPERLNAPDARLAGPLKVVHVTRYVFQKNTLMLVDVIAALRDMGELHRFEFELLGDGPGRAEFEAAVAERGLTDFVKVLGAVSNPGARMAEAFCMFSTSRWEGMPIALLEAMARAVPSIATDVTGNKDAVADGETGFLFPQGNPRLGAERLVQMACDPALWRQLVAGARLRAEREFSVETMAESTLRFYTSRSLPNGGVRVPSRILERPVAAFQAPAMAGGLHSSRKTFYTLATAVERTAPASYPA